jgi:hypothetical protein
VHHFLVALSLTIKRQTCHCVNQPFAMPSYKEYAAWIDVDDIKVPEYGIEVREGGRGEVEKIVACWIASKPNKARYNSLRLITIS